MLVGINFITDDLTALAMVTNAPSLAACTEAAQIYVITYTVRYAHIAYYALKKLPSVAKRWERRFRYYRISESHVK